MTETSGIITAMEFPWSKSQHRRTLLASPFPAEWQRILAVNIPAYSCLSSARQQKLRDTARILVAEKEWEGAGGLMFPYEIKVTVAGHAALLVRDCFAANLGRRRHRGGAEHQKPFELPGATLCL